MLGSICRLILKQYKLFKGLMFEYGLEWVFYRLLYNIKLKVLRIYPGMELVFEREIAAQRVDLIDLDLDAIKQHLCNLPVHLKERIICDADQAMNGIIQGFSSIQIDYGHPINWQLNPITRRAASTQKKWYEICDFDEDRGDIKVIWEASRFTHFFCFARAYLITEDIKYYQAFSQQLEQWLNNNPYGFGANYKCGQECALRMMNLLLVYSVFGDRVSAQDHKNLIECISRNYKKILSNFFYARKCIKNNHVLSEIIGRIIGAWCCENRKDFAEAVKMINEEIQSQFFCDGGYIQFSFNYQRMVFQLVEFLFKVSEKADNILSMETKELILHSVDMLYQVQDARDGRLPNYGHNDGSLIFPVSSSEYLDYRPTLNSLHALLTGCVLYPSGIYDEELLWFGNRTDYRMKHALRTSRAFPHAGLYVLRSEKSHAMICLNHYKTRPAHMDGLHFDLWYQGDNIFCDSGTYSYVEPEGQKLALTDGHNTVKVNGKEQMDRRGAFWMINWTKSKEVSFGPECFSGKMLSGNGYEHQRKVYSVAEGWRLEDRVDGDISSYALRFHTPYSVRQIDTASFQIYDGDRIYCLIQFYAKAGIYLAEESCHSTHYLKKEKNYCISAEFKKHLESKVITRITLQ